MDKEQEVVMVFRDCGQPVAVMMSDGTHEFYRLRKMPTFDVMDLLKDKLFTGKNGKALPNPKLQKSSPVKGSKQEDQRATVDILLPSAQGDARSEMVS